MKIHLSIASDGKAEVLFQQRYKKVSTFDSNVWITFYILSGNQQYAKFVQRLPWNIVLNEIRMHWWIALNGIL